MRLWENSIGKPENYDPESLQKRARFLPKEGLSPQALAWGHI